MGAAGNLQPHGPATFTQHNLSLPLHRQCFEHPPENKGPRDAHHGEHSAHLQVLRQRRVQPEDRKDQDLRYDRDAVADKHIGDGLGKRHEA